MSRSHQGLIGLMVAVVAVALLLQLAHWLDASAACYGTADCAEMHVEHSARD